MHDLSGILLRQLFIKNELSATEICNFFLHRIEQYEPALGSFLSIFSKRALYKAEELDAKRAQNKPLGKLAAIPIAIKDNIHVLGERTSCGSKFLSNYRALFDATVTRLIEEEDGVILGKTNLDEFAMGSSTEKSAFQLTKNPWDLSCSPGGSSGGSAAAVAARLCPISLGSDTGGSIRQPAAFCGIVGFKPSYGRVSRYGLVSFASSLDQIGPLTTTVADAALMMEVIGQHCKYDSTCLSFPLNNPLNQLKTPFKEKITLGIPKSFLKNLEREIGQNFQYAVESCEKLGYSIIEVDLDILNYSIAVYHILSTAEASTNLARFDGIRFGNRSLQAKTLIEVLDLSREEGFGFEVKQRILLGTYLLSSGYQEAHYRQAQKMRQLIIESFKKVFEKCQMIITPTAPSAAFELGYIQDSLEMSLQDIYTVPASLAGLPAISIPSGFSSKGLPLALHITARQFHDNELLQLAYHIEKSQPFIQKIPPQFDDNGD